VLKGVQLTLMMGPAVARPVSRQVLDALTSVQVDSRDTERSGFQLTFTLGARSPLHTLFLLSGGTVFPIVRVIIVVTVNGIATVLMDGMVTEHQILPGTRGGSATLSVMGEDLTVVMDKQDLSGFPFPAAPAEGRVALLLAKYAMLGVVPMVIPSVLIDVPIPTSRIHSQRGTDLEYIRYLADRVGYVFYLDPGPRPGMSVGYWGPQIKVGRPQPALNVDMDAHRNVESLTFSFDNNRNAIPTVFWYDELTKAIITTPIPPVGPLNPPLGALPPIPTRFAPVSDDLAKRSLPQAIMIGLGKASQWTEAVSGDGELDVLRYGRVLQARQLVGVRGAGPAFDGLHYVKTVTHNIERGSYKQRFTLSRNGLISTVPRVPA
jgi:hypothetical protein